MIVAKYLLVLCKIASMALSQSLMALGQDVSDQERETTAGQERKAGATNLVAEIVMMIITEKEAVNVRDTVIVIETVTESVIENESIAIVKREHRRDTEE